MDTGTYQISEGNHAGYTVSYSGDSDSNGKIALVSGDNKTVTITNNDIAIQLIETPTTLEPHETPITLEPYEAPTTLEPQEKPAIGVKRTVTGGQLPNTATPFYELIIIGVFLILFGLTMVGVVTLRKKKRLE